MLKTALAIKGFGLRLAYFTIAPFLLVFTTVKLPVLGAIINLAVFLTLFFVRGLLPGVGTQRFFRRIIRLENYYREHPPKPFLYYVFFPLLAPYWLFYRPARREIFLYRRLSGLGLLIVCAVKLVDYRRNWYPDIPFNKFLGVSIVGIILEVLVFLIIVIPIATTVVTYKLSGARKRLFVLGLAALLSMGLAVIGLMATKRPQVRTDILARMWLRADNHHDEATVALDRALDVALTHLPIDPNALEVHKLRKPIDGEPELLARESLKSFFRPDESAAFFLFVAETRAEERALVLMALSDKKKRAPVWRAAIVDKRGQLVRSTSEADEFDSGVIP